MAAQLTLTPQPTTGSIRLTIDPDEGDILSVQRSDANGTYPVRTVAGLLPSDEVTVINDYECALSGLVTYTVILESGTLSASTELSASTPWLNLPRQVNLSEALESVLDYTAGREAATTLHEVIGRPDPLATLGVLRMRQGSFDLYAPTYEAARSIERVYAAQQVALLRLPDHRSADLYHVALSVDTAPLNASRGDTRWVVKVGYIEVARPDGNVIGALGWTYESVATQHADYGALAALYETYADLQVGAE